MELFTLVLTVFILDSISKTQAGFLDAFDTLLDPGRIEEEPLQVFNPMYHINKGKKALDAGINGKLDRSYGRARNVWRNPQTNEENPIMQGYGDSETTTMVDKQTAQLFPRGVRLLNRLKELNKLKDEGKLPLLNNRFETNDENKLIDEGKMPSRNNQIKTTEEPTVPSIGISKEVPNRPKADEVKVVKSITKKKFFKQVQPVIPENERRDISETIYYVE